MKGERSQWIQQSDGKYCLKDRRGGSKGDGRRKILSTGRGRQAAWLKQKDAESAGNFGETSPLRTDNSESNKNELLEILDDDQEELMEEEAKGPGISNPHRQ